MHNLNLITVALADWRNWLTNSLVSVVAIAAGIVVQRLLFSFARRGAQNQNGYLLTWILRFAEISSRLILPNLFLLAAIPWLRVLQLDLGPSAQLGTRFNRIARLAGGRHS